VSEKQWVIALLAHLKIPLYGKKVENGKYLKNGHYLNIVCSWIG
jgi:hypothetical protein